MKTDILKDLIETKSIDEKNIAVYSEYTRDNKNLNVKIDKLTGVIFIDNFFVGDSEYINGEYKGNSKDIEFDGYESYEDKVDSKRRLNQFKKELINKSICDFGCGKGSFLKLANKYTLKTFGVEIQKSYLDEFSHNQEIIVENNIKNFKTKFDTIFLFHTLEHLPNQIKHLKLLKSYLNPGGKIIIEVPHARDYLLTKLNIKDFKDFTLWSQHLILHTKESLNNFLSFSGYKNIHVEGFQRYSIANHLGWLKNKKPGGHKSDLAEIENSDLIKYYNKSLENLDATDTIIAYANI
tara:strand:+ start:1137 stop:2018 length:882 start_codon:yes stop_codon:yes gene_type:complete